MSHWNNMIKVKKSVGKWGITIRNDEILLDYLTIIK